MRSTICLSAFLVIALVAACRKDVPTIGNHSIASFILPSGSRTLEEGSFDMPSSLWVTDARCAVTDSNAVVELVTQGSIAEIDGPITIEAYFDCKSDHHVQSRVLVWTSGGYKFGTLDGSGTAAVYVRELGGDEYVWRLIGSASVSLVGTKLRLSGELGVADGGINMIVIRHAPASLMKVFPTFRFRTDGIAATILFKTDRMRGRPMPRLPADKFILR